MSRAKRERSSASGVGAAVGAGGGRAGTGIEASEDEAAGERRDEEGDEVEARVDSKEEKRGAEVDRVRAAVSCTLAAPTRAAAASRNAILVKSEAEP